MDHFFHRRQHLSEVARREAAGESFWHATVDQETRRRIALTLSRIEETVSYSSVFTPAIRALAQDEGDYSYLRQTFGSICDTAPDDVFLSLIEAVLGEVDRLGSSVDSRLSYLIHYFSNEINQILSDDRLSYELIDGRFVPFESRALHTTVVEPTLTLLRRPRTLPKVEVAYRRALEELSHQHPDDAITDCGTALQELLIAKGCEGSALGSLLKSAKKKDLIPGRNIAFIESVSAAIDCVSANRSQIGDAHRVVDSTNADAWFIVHVVGALILRFESEGTTSSPTT